MESLAGSRPAGRAAGPSAGILVVWGASRLEAGAKGRIGGGGHRLNSLVFLVPIAVALAGVFLFLFLKAVKDGQFDDLDDPPRRILEDD